MTLRKIHPREDFLRYLDGQVSEDEKRSLEGHLESCEECRRYLSSVKQFNAGLGELTDEEFMSQEPHPDSWTLVSYEAGEADEETARHLRAHLLFCDECQEEFYALRRLRPKVMEVILRAAGSLIEVFRPPEMGDWESLLATVPVKGETVPSAPFRMHQMLIDDERNETRVAVQVELGLEPDHVRVLVDGEKVLPEWKWKVSLLDGREEEWTGMPFDKSKLVVASAVPFGLYTVEVRKGENCLGTFKFTIESINSDEALKKAQEYLRNGDYVRALAILKDALRREPENKTLLQELNRAAQEEGREENDLDADEKQD